MASPFTARQFQTLQLELQSTKRGTILWLTLNRPKAYNSLNMEMISELHVVSSEAWPCERHVPSASAKSSQTSACHLCLQVFDLLEHPTSMLQPVLEDHPRVVILQGAGSSFSAGVDIKARPPSLPPEARS